MLRDDRIVFTHKIAELIIWTKGKNWDLVFDEGKVFHERIGKLWASSDFSKHKFVDAVHKDNSFHYLGLAVDLLLYINGVNQPVLCAEWSTIGQYWMTLDPKCTWGGKFQNKSGDYNHFSWNEV